MAAGARSTHTRSHREDLSQAEKKAKQNKNKISSRPKKGEQRNRNGNVKEAHPGSQSPTSHRLLNSDRALLGAQCPRMTRVSGMLHAAPTRRASACYVDVDTEREEGGKILTSPHRHQHLQLPPSLSQQRSRVPSIVLPTMAMVPRTRSRRGPALPDISRREDSMTKRRASPIVHRTHGVPDVPMDGGRIYEGAVNITTR
jgi:hypothetical protein